MAVRHASTNYDLRCSRNLSVSLPLYLIEACKQVTHARVLFQPISFVASCGNCDEAEASRPSRRTNKSLCCYTATARRFI